MASRAGRGRATGPQMEPARAAFLKFDVNNAGALGPSELALLLLEQGDATGTTGDTAARVELAKQFREADADGDGLLSYDEFTALARMRGMFGLSGGRGERVGSGRRRAPSDDDRRRAFSSGSASDVAGSGPGHDSEASVGSSTSTVTDDNGGTGGADEGARWPHRGASFASDSSMSIGGSGGSVAAAAAATGYQHRGGAGGGRFRGGGGGIDGGFEPDVDWGVIKSPPPSKRKPTPTVVAAAGATSIISPIKSIGAGFSSSSSSLDVGLPGGLRRTRSGRLRAGTPIAGARPSRGVFAAGGVGAVHGSRGVSTTSQWSGGSGTIGGELDGSFGPSRSPAFVVPATTGPTGATHVGLTRSQSWRRDAGAASTPLFDRSGGGRRSRERSRGRSGGGLGLGAPFGDDRASLSPHARRARPHGSAGLTRTGAPVTDAAFQRQSSWRTREARRSHDRASPAVRQQSRSLAMGDFAAPPAPQPSAGTTPAAGARLTISASSGSDTWSATSPTASVGGSPPRRPLPPPPISPAEPLSTSNDALDSLTMAMGTPSPGVREEPRRARRRSAGADADGWPSASTSDSLDSHVASRSPKKRDER
mmetsp:Transcript_13407/g.46817  ORF Transcript_13407/g.46817 Transcript_13407/m.46817 type:complete len:594 (-) Transcript_13407:144-1925(-)